jgi:hypothetical protein
MKPKYIFRKEGSGKKTDFLILDAQTKQEMYRFASIDPEKDKPSNSPGCTTYLGWGCFIGLISLLTGDLELSFGGGGYKPVPEKWELRRADGSAVFQLQEIRRGFDILRNDSSIGRIEWKKRKKIINHQLILGDRLLATEVPTKRLRNEVHIEMESGRLATLKNTDSMTSVDFGELFIKRELEEEELGLILAIGLLWL